MTPSARHLGAPAKRTNLHVSLARPVPSPPEAVAHVAHRPFHPRLVLGLPGTSGVDQTAVVVGELAIRTVDLRVIEVGTVDPGRQIVDHEAPDHAPEEGERRHVRADKGMFI